MVGVCYDGVEGVLYLCLFSTLAACAFTVMLCAIPRAWRQIACRSVRSLLLCLRALISSSCSHLCVASHTVLANQHVCVCVCVCVNIFYNCRTAQMFCNKYKFSCADKHHSLSVILHILTHSNIQ